MFFCRIKKSDSWSYLCFYKTLLLSLYVGLVVGLNSLSASASGVGRLVDFLVTDSGVMEALSKNGIYAQEANYVRSSINRSLKALSFGSNKLDAQNLIDLLNQLPVSGRDVKLRSELMDVLKTSSARVSSDDFIQAINHLIYLSNRYSVRSSSVLACSECVSGALAARGFKFLMEDVNNLNAKKVLTEILPNDPKQLRQYIQTQMRLQGLGDFSRVTTDLVAPQEERSLALFLALKENGSSSQRNFISAVEQLSRNSKGELQLFQPERPHKLWRLFSEELSDKQIEGFTRLIREVDQLSRDLNISLKEAFGRVLEKRAGGDKLLSQRAQQLQRQNCFFQ